MNNVDWDKRFYEHAIGISTWSKDRNTGVGCVIVNDDKRIVSIGYNGFCQGFNDDLDSRHERPDKYAYTVHAEANAICSAVRSGYALNNCILYVTLFPCHECAKLIIQSGIKTIYAPKPDLVHNTWGQSFKYAIEMLNECGVIINYI